MTTHSSTTINKTTWGDGPWHEEPDKVRWTDETTHLPCLAVRMEATGTWHGYIGVTENHPWYRAPHTEIHTRDVHGGVRYAQFRKDDDPDTIWWVGFDCQQPFDLQPAVLPMLDPFLAATIRKGTNYRNLSFVQHQCEELARQAQEDESLGRIQTWIEKGAPWR